MGRPDGAHTHGGGVSIGDVLVAAAVLAAVAVAVAVVAFIGRYLWIILPAMALVVAGVIRLAWWWHRKYNRVAEVLPWAQPQALPAHQASPVESRATAALSGPRVVNHIYVVSPEQADELARRSIEPGSL